MEDFPFCEWGDGPESAEELLDDHLELTPVKNMSDDR